LDERGERERRAVIGRREYLSVGRLEGVFSIKKKKKKKKRT
jgi:hypothetical protein